MAGQRFNSGQVSNWGRDPFTTLSQLPPLADHYLPRLPMASANAGGTCGAYQELRVNFIPLSAPCTLSELVLSLNTLASTAGTVVRFGIYAYNNDGTIGNLIIDLGTIDVTTGSGLKTIDFSATPISITNGGFYFANVWQGANSTFGLKAYLMGASGGTVGYPWANSFILNTRAVSVTGSNYLVSNVTGALPTSPSWSVGDASNMPLHNWKVLSVP